MAIINPVRVHRAFISVFDKAGLVQVAKTIYDEYGIELVSTGGTRKTLAEARLTVRDVSELTGFPEMMDGRVKTLHPKVHGGLLAIRGDAKHRQSMSDHGIEPIDLLIVNLYPFEATVAKGASFDDCIENIDIGGPAMIRAAAKNHKDVCVIVDVTDYEALLREMKEHHGMTTETFRRKMAQKAYAMTASYDAAISNWFADKVGESAPAYRAFGGTLIQRLRYGENPHQTAAFYRTPEQRFGVATARQVQGKELSYNNINDTDAAYECVAEFDPRLSAAVAIIKHANPCGVAVGDTLVEAYLKAYACDSTSAFGGIVALNRKLDANTAQEIAKIFTEVIIASDASEDAIKILSQKKNLRLLLAGGLPDPRAAGLVAKTVAGGLLVQSRDNTSENGLSFAIVTKREPTPQESRDLHMMWKIAKHVKSNVIVFGKNGATVGIGAGQMNRIDSARIAHMKSHGGKIEFGEGWKLKARTRGSVAASDAFFPFADGLLACIEAGATAVIQPGGSVRDQEVIDAANEHGIAMVFTHVRHFRH